MKKYIFMILCLSLFAISCSEEELGQSLIDTSTPELNEVDKWIRENYTYPFNTEVKYRWDNSEVDNTKVLAPVEIEQVIPFLDGMKKIWIDPYVNNGGMDFMKKYIPKQIVLVGSHNYNDDGTIVLGQAEGGRRITIFDLNYLTFDFTGMGYYDKEDAMDNIRAIFKTMHHEFGHILHQTIMYPIEYKTLSTGYTANWTNYSERQARNEGFITPYSMLNPNEDFVEMLSEFLIRSNEEWNDLLDGIWSYEGPEMIRKKEKMVADYMLEVWKIDIYKLQKEISDNLSEVVN